MLTNRTRQTSISLTSNCWICGGKVEKFHLSPECTLYRCNKCGLILRNLQLCKAKARKSERLGGNASLDVLRLYYTKRAISGMIKKQFAHKKLNVLDIGFGRGSLLLRFAKEKHKVWGIDPDEELVTLLSNKTGGFRNINLLCGSLEDVQLPKKFFDIAYMFHVIEHFKEVNPCVKKLQESLKSGGILFIITPNGESKGIKLFNENWWYFEDPTHYQFFTPKSLKILLGNNGFEILEIRRPILESLTFEANSILRWSNLDIRNSILKISFLLLSSLFFLPIRFFYPSIHPSIEIIAQKK